MGRIDLRLSIYKGAHKMTLGGWEWVIILIIVLLVFGVGRISKLGSEMGKGISAFRDGMKEGQQDDEKKADETAEDSEA